VNLWFSYSLKVIVTDDITKKHSTGNVSFFVRSEVGQHLILIKVHLGSKRELSTHNKTSKGKKNQSETMEKKKKWADKIIITKNPALATEKPVTRYNRTMLKLE
jgi:hypothetical protein